MKSFAKLAAAAISLACLSAPVLAHPGHELPIGKFDDKGIARTETVRSDFDGNRNAIQVIVDFAEGASFPAHVHPGVEIAFVLRGEVEYVMDGKTIRLKAGESLYIPAGASHSARNVGSGVASELATYLVEKNKPIVVLSK